MNGITQKIGIDAQVLIDTMRKLNVGESISYEELSETIGARVNGSNGALYTARNRLMRDLDMVFGTVRGEGLKRLNDKEKIGVASFKIEQVKRTAQRGINIIQTINPDLLEKNEVSALNLTVSHLGILAYASSAKARNKIEQKVIANNGKLPPGITLEALR